MKHHLNSKLLKNKTTLQTACGIRNTKAESVEKFLIDYEKYPEQYCKKCVAKAKKEGLL